jgi:hypothetical protein
MKKKVTSPKSIVEKVLNVDGDNLPNAVAKIAKEYQHAFLTHGFNSEQSYELTLLFMKFYLRAIE